MSQDEPPLTTCPHCGVKTVVSVDRKCLVCRRNMDEKPSPPILDKPPSFAIEQNLPSTLSVAQERFAMQAAKFSAFAPFVMAIMEGMAGKIHRNPNSSSSLPSTFEVAVVIFGIRSIVTIAAFLLGVYAIRVGIRFRKWKIIGLSLFGVLLNAVVFYFVSQVVLLFFSNA